MTTRPWSLASALALALGMASGCAERGIAPVQSAAVADSSDQILEQMTTAIVHEGVRKSLIYADTAYIYTNRQVASLRNMRVTFYDGAGNATSILTARHGDYFMAVGTLEARDSVLVISTDGSNRRLEAKHLIYDRNQDQVRSDSTFRFESPTEVLTGSSFVSDPGFKNVTTRQPKGRQRGEGILLPGQD